MLQPYPPADAGRLDRLIQDIADTMNQTDINDKFKRFAERRIVFVLAEIARSPLWFLNNLSASQIEAGQDLVDFQGDVDKISALYAPLRLHKIPLSAMAKLRQHAAANNLPNAAPECTHYALEAGRRVHLWPAPSGPVALQAIYTRPPSIELLPEGYLSIVHDGVVGLYGRHWTKLLDEHSAAFERNFRRALPSLRIESWDATHLDAPREIEAARLISPANSSTDTAVDHVVPASLSGIGAAVIYPFEVA